MAKQTISIGTTANDGTGDTLRDAFDKANDNFTELYASGGGGDLVDDTTPQLGGDLDLNGNQITGSGGTVTTSQPIIDVSQTWNDAAVTFTGIKANITDTASAATSSLIDFQVGTNSIFSINKTGDVTTRAQKINLVSNTTNQVAIYAGTSGAGNPIDIGGYGGVLSTVALRVVYASLTIRNANPLGWASGANINTAQDLSLWRDAAGVLAQRVGTAAQTFRLYNTWTDASNYERLAFTWDSNVAKIQTEAAGTGTLRLLQLGPMYTATLKSGLQVTAVTTTASPASTDTGTVYTNEGDADGATVTLPTAAAGLQFTAYVQAAQTLTITAGSGDTIRIASSVTAAAGSITSAVVGSSVTLVAINNTEWVATSSVGSWSF